MRLSEREYVEIDLANAERHLNELETSPRQTEPTEAGRALRAALRADIAHLRKRLVEEQESDRQPEGSE